MSVQDLPSKSHLPVVGNEAGERILPDSIEVSSVDALHSRASECLRAPEFQQLINKCELGMRKAIIEWRVEPSRFDSGLTISQNQQLIAMLLEGIQKAADMAFNVYAQNSNSPDFKDEIQYLACKEIPERARRVWNDVTAFRNASSILSSPFGIVEEADFFRDVRDKVALFAERAIADIMARRTQATPAAERVNGIPVPVFQGESELAEPRSPDGTDDRSDTTTPRALPGKQNRVVRASFDRLARDIEVDASDLDDHPGDPEEVAYTSRRLVRNLEEFIPLARAFAETPPAPTADVHIEANKKIGAPSLGEIIRRARQAKLLSQPGLTALLDIGDRSTISDWETGTTVPHPDNLKLLSKHLCISLEELVFAAKRHVKATPTAKIARKATD